MWSRAATIAGITVGYVLVWGAAFAAFYAVGVAWPDNGGPEFNWRALGMAILGGFVVLIAGHVVWAVRVVRLLRPFGHALRTGLAVIAPPVSLVVVTIARNESLVPWQLWPVALVAVPAIGAISATAGRLAATPRP